MRIRTPFFSFLHPTDSDADSGNPLSDTNADMVLQVGFGFGYPQVSLSLSLTTDEGRASHGLLLAVVAGVVVGAP